jgi:hypothetical protein
VGIFGASPHVGRKPECVVVDAAPSNRSLEIFAKCSERDVTTLLKGSTSQ